MVEIQIEMKCLNNNWPLHLFIYFILKKSII